MYFIYCPAMNERVKTRFYSMRGKVEGFLFRHLSNNYWLVLLVDALWPSVVKTSIRRIRC